MKGKTMEQQTCKTGFRWESRNCVDCGKTFVAKSHNSVRCLDCRHIHNLKMAREYQQKKKETEEVAKPTVDKNLNICKKIRRCQHGGKMGGVHICDFLSQMGYRRPCPAGRCTEYKRKTRRGGV